MSYPTVLACPLHGCDWTTETKPRANAQWALRSHLQCDHTLAHFLATIEALRAERDEARDEARASAREAWAREDATAPTLTRRRFDQCTETCTADCGHCKGRPVQALRAEVELLRQAVVSYPEVLRNRVAGREEAQ